jgi:molecular chaperone DnaK (HSP70)
MSKKRKFSDSDITKLEKESISKANQAISAIESAIEACKASDEKQEEYDEELKKLRYFRDAMSKWVKKMLVSMKKKDDLKTRVERLREFSDICYAYSQW